MNGSSGSAAANAAMLQMYQQQQRRHHPHHQSYQNGVRTPNGTPNMFDTQTSNGTSIQFSSSSGTGGTWSSSSATNNNPSNNSQNNGGYNMAGYSMMGGMMTNGNCITFKCCECSINKNSCEELEIHIKTEHLNWLPFRCLKCAALRASDTQMREHMFSSHRNEKNIALNHYAYIDNSVAKRDLQSMLDRALTEAAGLIATKRMAMSSQSRLPPTKRQRMSEGMEDINDGGQPLASATVTVLPKSNTNDILAQLTAARSDDNEPIDNGLASVTEGNDGAEEPTSEFDEFTTSQLSNVFGKGVMSQYDDYQDNGSNYSFNVSDGKDLIENISALLGNSIGEAFPPSSGKMVRTRAPRGSRNVNCVSKKRVLGECSRCQKPVTAGARQMHMFYHLGKDYNTYRFKCKFDDCEVEHYRKDQMENHQSKQHGRIDPDMMEDRSAELADMVQELSLELLGTTGNQPGPTAEKAQMMYELQQKELLENQNKKRKRASYAPADYSLNQSQLQTSPSTSSIHSPRSNGDNSKRTEDKILCLQCNKEIVMRVRGFHLLEHLSNDLGIIRYNCKHCSFKHKHAQSVLAHGRHMHNDEDCVEDSLGKYEEEVKSMSMACFGIEQKFTKESTRFKKSGVDVKDDTMLIFEDDKDMPELDENDTQMSDDVKDIKHSPTKDPLLPSLVDAINTSTSKGTPTTTTSTPSSAVKRKSMRRFGTRRPKSKKQKLEMAKLRELSLLLGGAQYFRKRVNDTAICNQCGKVTQSRLSHHAYSHLDVHLFQCPECQLGHPSRDQVVKHMKDFHNSTVAPIDNRLKYAQEIKDAIRDCYPHHFIDAPIPTTASIEKLKGSVDLSNTVLSGFEDSNENDENASDGEGDHDEGDHNTETNDTADMEDNEDEIPKLYPNAEEEPEPVEA